LEKLLTDLYGSLEESKKSGDSKADDLANNNRNDKKQSSNLELSSKQTDTVLLRDGVWTDSYTNIDLSSDRSLLHSNVVDRHEIVCTSKDMEIMQNVPDSHNRVMNIDLFPNATVCVHNIGPPSNVSDDASSHQVASSGNQGQDLHDLGEFSDMFEHPLLQDLQSVESSDKTTHQRDSFAFSDMNFETKHNFETNQQVAVSHVSEDLELGFADQYRILSGGYEKGHRIMGPKGDDLSLLGQHRKSAASDSEASQDSIIAVPSGDTKLFCGKVTGGTADLECSTAGQAVERRLSIPDIWSKGQIVGTSGKSVEVRYQTFLVTYKLIGHASDFRNENTVNLA
jgi:hypothetical protein